LKHTVKHIAIFCIILHDSFLFVVSIRNETILY